MPALEGVFVGLMLVTAMAIVATIPPPSQDTGAARESLAQTLEDVLRSMDQLPTGDAYKTKLEQALGQAILGNTGPLNGLLDRVLPESTQCRLVVDNGHAKRIVAGTPERTARESVSGSVLYRPTWSYAFVMPTLEYITPTQPLEVQGFAVSQGSLVKEAGIPITVEVNIDGGASTYTKATITSLRDGPSASFFLLDPAGLPGYVWTDPVPAIPESDFTFVLRNDGSKPLPAGTRVTVWFTADFGSLDTTTSPQDGWRGIIGGEVPETGHRVAAELETELPPETTRPLTITGIRQPLRSDPSYLVRAELSNGTSSRSSFVIGSGVGLPDPSNPLLRGPYLSVPKPLAPGRTATWSLVFANPGVALLAQQNITSFSIGSATPLFASVTPLKGGGSWVATPTLLTWVGHRSVAANAAVEFTFNVTTLSETSPDEPSFRMPVNFPVVGTSLPLHDQRVPHVYTLSIPPHGDDPGYTVPSPEEFTGVPPAASAALEVAWHVPNRRVLVEGGASYQISTSGALSAAQEALRTGLAQSRVMASTSQACIGDVVTATVDFQGLLDELQRQAGLDVGLPVPWEVSFRIFDPAQPFTNMTWWVPSYAGYYGGTPDYTITLQPQQTDLPSVRPPPFAGHLQLEGITAPTSATTYAWDVQGTARTNASATFTFQPPRWSYFGPHILMGEAKLFLKTLDGPTVLQSARTMALLDVVPDSGQSGSALYWVSLECLAARLVAIAPS